MPGQEITHDQQISFMNWRIQMRDYREYQVVKQESQGTHYFLKGKYLDPDKVEVKPRQTLMGTKYYVRDKKWDKLRIHPKERINAAK